MESCERILKKELIIQRRALEEQVKKDTQPARDLDEYSASTVAYLSSKTLPGQISPTEKSEKQGWLFMRSFTSKPTKVIWVRRWFFIRGGIFGYLMQGYRNGQVEESERVNYDSSRGGDEGGCGLMRYTDWCVIVQCKACLSRGTQILL